MNHFSAMGVAMTHSRTHTGTTSEKSAGCHCANIAFYGGKISDLMFSQTQVLVFDLLSERAVHVKLSTAQPTNEPFT